MKNWRSRFFVVSFLIGSVVVLPSTIILLAGMSPTIIAVMMDKTKEKLRGFTVGCANLGFCFPYWLNLIQTGHTPENALAILTPLSFSIMMCGAVLGYLLEFVFVKISEFITKAKNAERLKTVLKTQKEMTERWGREVTGELPLDKYGFEIISKES